MYRLHATESKRKSLKSWHLSPPPVVYYGYKNRNSANEGAPSFGVEQQKAESSYLGGSSLGRRPPRDRPRLAGFSSALPTSGGWEAPGTVAERGTTRNITTSSPTSIAPWATVPKGSKVACRKESSRPATSRTSWSDRGVPAASLALSRSTAIFSASTRS